MRAAMPHVAHKKAARTGERAAPASSPMLIQPMVRARLRLSKLEVSSFDKRNRARTMGWMSMGEDAGAALSPVLAAFLWATWGIAALMGFRVALALATELYVLLITRNPGGEDSEARVLPRRRAQRTTCKAPRAL